MCLGGILEILELVRRMEILRQYKLRIYTIAAALAGNDLFDKKKQPHTA